MKTEYVLSVFNDNEIDFSKDSNYKDSIKINTSFVHHNYKNVNINHKKDIELYFLTLNKDKYKKTLFSKNYENNNSDLKKMLWCFKINKDINRNMIISIFKLKDGQYCIISYNVNLIPSPINIYICYVKQYIEILMYLFKIESEMKMDTKNSHLIKYPKCFFKNFNFIYNYFN